MSDGLDELYQVSQAVLSVTRQMSVRDVLQVIVRSARSACQSAVAPSKTTLRPPRGHSPKHGSAWRASRPSRQPNKERRR